MQALLRPPPKRADRPIRQLGQVGIPPIHLQQNFHEVRTMRKRSHFWFYGAALTVAAVVLSAWAIAQDNPRGENQPTVAHGYAKQLSTAFRGAADEVLPAVVMLKNIPKAAESSPRAELRPFGGEMWSSPFGDLMPNHPELRRFFEEMPSNPGTQRRAPGIGSGVIIDPSGVILTNRHVVEGGGEIAVRLLDGGEFTATDVKSDPKTDIAVIRIQGVKDLKAARLGDSDEVAVGDWVLALGQPFGLEGTVTAGIVSAKGRGIGITDRENFIQTDAAINPGNSGGPLVNLDGEVIGINTAISSRSGGYQGVGFAVPVNLANWVSRELLEHGVVRRAYLGVAIQPVTHQLAEQFGVETNKGVLVANVQDDAPAAKAGLQAGDVIVSFDGTAVTSPAQLQGLVEKAEVGQKQKLSIIRDGKRLSIDVTCLEMPQEYGLSRNSSSGSGSAAPRQSQFDKLGIAAEDLTAEVAEQLGVESGQGVVITSVKPGSIADLAGLRPGLVIAEVNRKAVNSVNELREALKDQQLETGILLLVRDGSGARFIVLRARG